MNKFLLFALLVAAGFSCKKSVLSNAGYLVFGFDGGSVPGNFVYYKLQNENLYRSSPYIPGQTSITYNSEPLSNDKYTIARVVKDEFPGYLSNHPNQTFGCPNCVDQGRIYLEVKQNNEVTHWNIDTNISEQPAEIRPYLQKVRQIISQL